MNKKLFFCSLMSLFLGLNSLHGQEDRTLPLTAEQITNINKKLENFQTEKNNTKTLKIIYFHGSDREPIENYQNRINGWFNDYNDFFKKEFKRNGFGEKTVNLEYLTDKQIKIYTIQGKKKDSQYNYDVQSGYGIYEEVKAYFRKNMNIDLEQETGLIICALSKTDSQKRIVKLYAPFYGLGIGTQLKGWALVADQEWLDVKNFSNVLQKLTVGEHSNNQMSLGTFNTIYIGGALHELGHALGLPHDFETGKERQIGVPLMGSGNYTYRASLRGEDKDTYLSFCEAVRLISHPLFSKCRKEEKYSPYGSINHFYTKFDLKKGLMIQGNFKDSRLETYAVLAYCDPEGKGDYDSLVYVSDLDENGFFKINISNIPQGFFQIRLVFCCVNGGVSQLAFDYEFKDNNLFQK